MLYYFLDVNCRFVTQGNSLTVALKGNTRAIYSAKFCPTELFSPVFTFSLLYTATIMLHQYI